MEWITWGIDTFNAGTNMLYAWFEGDDQGAALSPETSSLMERANQQSLDAIENLTATQKALHKTQGNPTTTQKTLNQTLENLTTTKRALHETQMNLTTTQLHLSETEATLDKLDDEPRKKLQQQLDLLKAQEASLKMLVNQHQKTIQRQYEILEQTREEVAKAQDETAKANVIFGMAHAAFSPTKK